MGSGCGVCRGDNSCGGCGEGAMSGGGAGAAPYVEGADAMYGGTGS